MQKWLTWERGGRYEQLLVTAAPIKVYQTEIGAFCAASSTD